MVMLSERSLFESDSSHSPTTESSFPARPHEMRGIATMADALASAQRALDLSAREAQRRLAASVARPREASDEPIDALLERARHTVHKAADAIETARRRVQADLASAADALLVEALILAAARHLGDEACVEPVAPREADGREV